MRWRLIDKVTGFQPWHSIVGRKCVSLDECLVLEPLGREGAFPEALQMECCVELVRWLVWASAGYACSATLTEMTGFAFERPCGPSVILRIEALVTARTGSQLDAKCALHADLDRIAHGDLRFGLNNRECIPPDAENDWEVLRG